MESDPPPESGNYVFKSEDLLFPGILKDGAGFSKMFS